MELALIEKRQNEANWYRPQILCPQKVNVGWIRPSLCKTNPIPGVRTGHRRATHSGSRHADKLCPSRPGSSKCQVTGPGGGTGRYRAKGVRKCLSFNALRLRFRLVASDFPGIVYILNGVCTGLFGMPISGWRWD